MTSRRTWIIINISLVFLIGLQVAHLLDIQLPTLGMAFYALDKEEPYCVVNWQNDFIVWDELDRCCLEVRKQVECLQTSSNNADWVCQSGTDGVLKYWLNNKAYAYCRQQPLWT